MSQTELDALQRDALIESVREAYMEVFPTGSIESRLDALQPGSYVAVTCSPSKGADETIAMSERLAARGFRVVPHIAARSVADRSHLRDIVRRLRDQPIISVFVPGGDADEPVGDYSTALQLLRDLADMDHNFSEIGVAAHPEGHAHANEDELLHLLLEKQQVANYLVTQMCFEADLIGNWLQLIRNGGVTIPAWLGIPGVVDRSALLKTSLRIGVGDSVRFLKKRGDIARRLLRSKTYSPNQLLYDLAPYLADPSYGIGGHHLYCFNQVAGTEAWRADFLYELTGAET